ncbi:SlyX family protein [Neptunicella marina]|uniref:Protein SlyX homolog n=1 Tax=Neptunicella marina TaxID=2125989 RepID=A0A8J6LXZ2_9ALTE|nr:SlyX family protein [Neptunicella marina]MBC3765939.1 SlyX family protein [Neptunicella marina]
MNNYDEQFEQLETKIAFQEHTIELLNEALTSQQQQLEKAQYQIAYLLDKVKSMQGSNLASDTQETPPPHY